MAFRPEPMQRTLIASSRSYERPIIETLHELRAAHLVEFNEDRSGEFAEFRIGRPLPEAGPTSERLVRLRALIRHLDLEGHVPEASFSVGEVEERLSRDLDAVEAEILAAVESRGNVQAQVDRFAEEEARLEPLRNLPLRLEDYRGYESLAVFVGHADGDVASGVRNVAPDHELVRDPASGLFALFVPAAKRSEVADVLLRAGFKEYAVPEGTGSVVERIGQLGTARRELAEQASRSERDLAESRGRFGDFIVAAEEHLSIEVTKAEAPLAFASTENAFIVDAWVPATRTADVDARLKQATNGNVHVTFTRETAASGHGHGHEEGHEEHVEEAPPTEYANPGTVRPFQFFTDMFSTPKYTEVDPTTILAIAFPLFFGFMIGDLGLGLVMAGLGWLLYKKLGHIPDLKNLGYALAVAGIVAAVFGGFVFKDAFGIPLGFTHHMDEELEHLGIEAACTGEVYQALGEATWGCLLGGSTAHMEPIVGKVTDVTIMLLLSLVAAFLHLGIGLLIGLKNEAGHDKKHALAKVGWIVLLLTFFPATIALIAPEYLPVASNVAFLGAGAGLVVGGVILGITEGIVGIIEIPSMLSNLLSYLRLGAVAIAKGAMAIAFNKMFLVDMTLAPDTGIALVVLGLVLTVFAQAVLFVLGVLSSGIQAIRLNYVEFFTKFYHGGGRKFTPFGSFRKYTTA